ncbi:unnamed protein product [Callosobruchus maculatus]|uniref:SUEL-type lectin domain-containing protein n=1 Tax=Callosobruchus maculatus TaxID=64391 RepID=A0A653DIN5_CALMS|nr:unnamed protein product [Callosobruchus maculatus]
MEKSVILISIACVFGVVLGEDLHLIEPKPGQCYDTYTENQPIYLGRIPRACVRRLPNQKDCVGLRTKNNETIVLECKGARTSKTLEPGCYRIINKDKSDGVVCQKYMKRRGCEVITTPSNLNIEVYCHPVLGTDASVIVVKDNKPRRERRDKNT